MKDSSSTITLSHPRLENELKTIEAMISIYCRAHHTSGKVLCADCEELLKYAGKRLANCQFQEAKPTCGNCTVHCYKPKMRETIRTVMRYAGPRMCCRHPIMALRHLLDGRRKPPEPAAKNTNDRPAPPPTDSQKETTT